MSFIETIRSAPFVNGYYQISTPQYGDVVVSPQGLEVIASDEPQTETTLTSLLKRSKEIRAAMAILTDPKSTRRQLAQVPKYVNNTRYGLRPHVQIKHKHLGSGSEGSAFQFYYPRGPIVIKVYESVQNKGGEGFDQFRALFEISKIRTVFRTPVPYFATDSLCAMEDFSSLQDYFAFIRQYPGEEIRLLEYLLQLAEEDELVADMGDIIFCYTGYDKKPPRIKRDRYFDKFSKGSSSVFVTQYDPTSTTNEGRFKLATVDVRIDDKVKKRSTRTKEDTGEVSKSVGKEKKN